MTMTANSARISVKNILYATDFSRQSDAALPFALSLARRYGSRILAVHVISAPLFPSSSPTEAWQAMAAQAVREAHDAMDRLEPRWEGLPHQRIIRRGDVWAELAAVIEAERVDLVVIGTHGRTGVSRALLGSAAEAVFRNAPCPVLTVGPAVVGEPESVGDLHAILYPTDFTAESLVAAPYALSLAQETGARLYLLHVAEHPVGSGVEAELVRRLLSLVPHDAGLWCEPRPLVEAGEPAEKILEVAEELAVDLIVLGPRRTARIPGATHLPMTTAYKVVCGAICPVLSVRGTQTHGGDR